jgi:hypothetical protein
MSLELRYSQWHKSITHTPMVEFVWIFSEMATVHFSAAAKCHPAVVTADE